ncbi:MAG TPA: YbaB/EbfC family nucleoid-associated protein [Verrucomicrobiae bacterium]|nr:YbaB/EbfC family nucleoid-associated protein [Verrucomicrobiae bacterium]
MRDLPTPDEGLQNDVGQEEMAVDRGGAVKAVAKCDGSIVSVKIDPKVVDPKDVEMLEDLVLRAVTNAFPTAKKTQEDELGKVTAGMNLPAMM